MKLGEIIVKKYIVKEQLCEECGEPAKYKHTYLLKNCRSNPASKAYGKDDCSWCEDNCKFACKEHDEKVRRDIPMGMSWCSSFPRERFEHMFLYKEELE